MIADPGDRFEKELSQGERGFTRVEGYRYGDPVGKGDRLPLEELRLYVGNPDGNCWLFERGNVRSFFHYFCVFGHDFHVAFR